MPKPYPKEFRDDVIQVARKRDADVVEVDAPICARCRREDRCDLDRSEGESEGDPLLEFRPVNVTVRRADRWLCLLTLYTSVR